MNSRARDVKTSDMVALERVQNASGLGDEEDLFPGNDCSQATFVAAQLALLISRNSRMRFLSFAK